MKRLGWNRSLFVVPSFVAEFFLCRLCRYNLGLHRSGRPSRLFHLHDRKHVLHIDLCRQRRADPSGDRIFSSLAEASF